MIRAAFPLLLLAAACDRGPSEAELRARAEALAATADPAITAALADPIMTDTDLAVADNSRRVRLVTGPARADYPLPGGDNAAAFARLRALGGPPTCETGFVSDGAEAGRLPPAFRPGPDSTLVEAAANARPGCRARWALFRSPAPPAAIAARYRARALAAGYGAEARVRASDHVVAGRRLDGGPGYHLVAAPRGGGSEVAVIVAVP